MKKNRVMAKRTDLAVEFIKKKPKKKIEEKLKITDLAVGLDLSVKLNRPVGRYVTIETDQIKKHEQKLNKLVEALAKVLKELTRGAKKILVVGLGNQNITADALGKKVCDCIATGKSGDLEICTLCPSVLGLTGIESFDVISAVVKKIVPNTIIVVDSLAAAAVKRIASAFQITDAGITPGSGVSNHRETINSNSMGCRVIAVGVPMVVYVSTIINDLTGKEAKGEESEMIVTPKDIDIFIESCANVISSAINSI